MRFIRALDGTRIGLGMTAGAIATAALAGSPVAAADESASTDSAAVATMPDAEVGSEDLVKNIYTSVLGRGWYEDFDVTSVSGARAGKAGDMYGELITSLADLADPSLDLGLAIIPDLGDLLLTLF